MGLITALLIFVLLMLYSSWATAFVGVHLWIWFIVPAVFHVFVLTMPQAFGLSLLIGYLTYQFHQGTKDERDIKEKVIKLVTLLLNL